MYQNFGKKAYWFFFSKWLQTPALFLFIAILTSVAGRTGFVPLQFRQATATATIFCLALAILSAIVCIIASRIVFNRRQFCLAEDAFKFREGIMSMHEIAIPYRQVQNVEIERSFYQQMMGVSRLVISTAGEYNPNTPKDDSRAVLDNLDKDVALELQEELLRKADVQKVVSTSGIIAK